MKQIQITQTEIFQQTKTFIFKSKKIYNRKLKHRKKTNQIND